MPQSSLEAIVPLFQRDILKYMIDNKLINANNINDKYLEDKLPYILEIKVLLDENESLKKLLKDNNVDIKQIGLK